MPLENSLKKKISETNLLTEELNGFFIRKNLECFDWKNAKKNSSKNMKKSKQERKTRKNVMKKKRNKTEGKAKEKVGSNEKEKPTCIRGRTLIQAYKAKIKKEKREKTMIKNRNETKNRNKKIGKEKKKEEKGKKEKHHRSCDPSVIPAWFVPNKFRLFLLLPPSPLHRHLENCPPICP